MRIRRKSLIPKEWEFEPKSLGEHLRRRRLALSLIQEEAATHLGVNAWTVHNWETGVSKPAIQFIPALVGFLGYDPEPVDEGTLAGRLVAKRRELGLSQLQAARSIGVDPAAWAGWEILCRAATLIEGFGLIFGFLGNEREGNPCELSGQGDQGLGRLQSAGQMALVERFPRRLA